MQTLQDALIVAALLGSGLVAGIFFAFSNFVMRALGRLKASEGAAAMQAINVTVLNPLFLGIFAGTALVCLAVAALGVWGEDAESGWALHAACALYVFGCFGVTAAGNVPMNEELARADRDDPGTAALWGRYLRRWTLLNHLRTLASFAAALLFALVGR